MNARRIMRTMVCAAALGLAAPVLAQSLPGIHAGALEVPVNKSQVVSTDRPIARAMIGNAEIADVMPISDRSVYVLGKKLGTTSLTLYDGNNRVLAVMDVAVGPDVEGLRRQLTQLVPGQTIDVRISNESIILSGMVSDPGAADRAALLAKAYAGDKVINLITVGGSQQVMLEVRFSEVNRTMGEKLGVNLTGASRGGSFDGSSGAGLLADAFGSIRKAFSIGNTDFNAYLDTLERRGLSKTLAEPTLIALSGEKASFLAGGEFPIPVAQSGVTGGTNAITVEFKPFGVSLSFTPTVLGDKVISLVVEPEVSSIDPTASVTINGLVVPGLQTRRASTTLELRDGESFAIAGLLSRDFKTTVSSIPLLGQIPILGALFRSSSFQKGETELLIVVTPRLVAPLRPDQVRLPTDRIADPKAFDVLTDGEGYRPIPLAPQPAAPTAPPAAEPGKVGLNELPPEAQISGTVAPAVTTLTPKEQGYAY